MFAQALLNRPDFIARFGERSRDVAELLARYVSSVAMLAGALEDQLETLNLVEPIGQQELAQWLGNFIGGTHPERKEEASRAVALMIKGVNED